MIVYVDDLIPFFMFRFFEKHNELKPDGVFKIFTNDFDYTCVQFQKHNSLNVHKIYYTRFKLEITVGWCSVSRALAAPFRNIDIIYVCM